MKVVEDIFDWYFEHTLGVSGLAAGEDIQGKFMSAQMVGAERGGTKKALAYPWVQQITRSNDLSGWIKARGACSHCGNVGRDLVKFSTAGGWLGEACANAGKERSIQIGELSASRKAVLHQIGADGEKLRTAGLKRVSSQMVRAALGVYGAIRTHSQFELVLGYLMGATSKLRLVAVYPSTWAWQTAERHLNVTGGQPIEGMKLKKIAESCDDWIGMEVWEADKVYRNKYIEKMRVYIVTSVIHSGLTAISSGTNYTTWIGGSIFEFDESASATLGTWYPSTWLTPMQATLRIPNAPGQRIFNVRELNRSKRDKFWDELGF